MTRALAEIRPGMLAAVDVYRDGDVVTVVGAAVKRTPSGGEIRTAVHSTMSVQDYEWAKQKAFERAPLAYTRIVGALGVNDDVRDAPPLPAHLRHLLPPRLQAGGGSYGPRALPRVAGRGR